MEEADLIIFLLFNRFTCFFRAWKRYRKNKGKARPDMAAGCEEKFDLEFARWVFYKGRTKQRSQVFYDLMKSYPAKSVLIKNQRQLTKFLERKL